MNKRKIFFVVLLLISSISVGFAQNRKNLEADKLKIEKEIIKLNKQLADTKKDKNASTKQLSLLKKRIEEREKLIVTINKQVSTISTQIDSAKKNISFLHLQIDSLKMEYAIIIRMLYHQHSLDNTLTYVFDSKNFSEAFQRVQSFKNYSSFSRAKSKEILQKESELVTVNKELEKQKINQVQLLSQEQEQKERLANESKQKQKSLTQIQQDEKKLLALREQKRKEAINLQSKIQKLIEEEVRKKQEKARLAREKAEKEAKNAKNSKTPVSEAVSSVKPKEAYTMAVTPEAITLSNKFIENKGNLPWPTVNASVSGAYGETIHIPTQGKNYNHGISILTTSGSTARCVFNGVVGAVMTDPNGYSVVIVEHGEFCTVYTNLEDVKISKGTKVVAKQDLGKIHTDNRDGKTEMKFQIWKATVSQNPAVWLVPLK